MPPQAVVRFRNPGRTGTPPHPRLALRGPSGPPRWHRLEPRLLFNATPLEIAEALDLVAPEDVAVTYAGDAAAVDVRTSAKSGGVIGFPSGFDDDFLVLS